MIVSRCYEDLSVLHDNHQYTNIRYPFLFDPPYLPHDIPCGAYVNHFVTILIQSDPVIILMHRTFIRCVICMDLWLLMRLI